MTPIKKVPRIRSIKVGGSRLAFRCNSYARDSYALACPWKRKQFANYESRVITGKLRIFFARYVKQWGGGNRKKTLEGNKVIIIAAHFGRESVAEFFGKRDEDNESAYTMEWYCSMRGALINHDSRTRYIVCQGNESCRKLDAN